MFLIIMETHIPFARTIFFWNRLGYSPVHILEAQGYAGGLWVLIQNGYSVSIDVCQFSISLKIVEGDIS